MGNGASAIITPPPPPAVLEKLHTGLRAAARAPGSVVPQMLRLKISPGLPLYLFGGDNMSALAAGKSAGWRFLVHGNRPALWVDVTKTGVQAIYAGPLVANLVAAARSLESAGARGEARICAAPLIEGAALWVDAAEPRLWEFSPRLARSGSSEAGLLGKWKKREAALRRGSAAALDE